MTTKEQERQAIDKIREIIEKLGDDSYVAAAMSGVLELAEENITNDEMCSWMDRANAAQKKVDSMKIGLDNKTKENNTIKCSMEEMKQELAQRRVECINLRMTQRDAKDLIEIVRVEQGILEEKARNEAANMAYAVLHGENEAKEFAENGTRQMICLIDAEN